ncbi:Bor/Iss family lipoprotein [Aquiflexum sp.]|uniref:Bor/Iss family lipoprotein n=1 Tax=Aquiflexum sp. TaxID=1872584 RepID=UPI00359373BB
MNIDPRQRLQLAVFFFSLIFLLSGCSNLRVVAKYDSDNPVPTTVTKVSYFWGLRQPVDVRTASSCKSICQVTAKTNAGQIIVSFITLGIVVPQTIEYFCCAEEPQPVEI